LVAHPALKKTKQKTTAAVATSLYFSGFMGFASVLTAFGEVFTQ
jgi:hypothetical protein